MKIIDSPEFDNHEAVAFAADEKSGLRSFIAIHNTNLGPATGGTRYWDYRSEKEALGDVLRLSKAMTYKCALARVPFGGGKAVIIANSHNPRRKEILAVYAKRINLFGGNFSTGEDVGINESDVALMHRHSRFINGRVAGDLGFWTARGLYYAVLTALKSVFGSSEIRKKTFAVKGLGKVGTAFCEIIYKNGGKIIAADLDKEKIKRARKKFPGMEAVEPREIHKQRADVYAPCALGGEFNKKTIPQLRCKIICGGANNQLSSKEDGERLHSWGILYIPDYLANAGGLINVVSEMNRDGYSRTWVKRKVKEIGGTAKKVIALSQERNKSTSEIADRLAEKIFRKREKR